jgi:hypothetical protein
LQGKSVRVRGMLQTRPHEYVHLHLYHRDDECNRLDLCDLGYPCQWLRCYRWSVRAVRCGHQNVGMALLLWVGCGGSVGCR